MINLLPPLEKQALKAQARQQLALVIGWMAVIALGCLALALVSVKFLLLQETLVARESLRQALEVTGAGKEDPLQASIVRYDGIIAKVNSFYANQPALSEALA